MTVAQLKAQLIGIPDSAELVLRGSDHSFRRATVESTTALASKAGLWEDFEGYEMERGESRIPVLLFQ